MRSDKARARPFTGRRTPATLTKGDLAELQALVRKIIAALSCDANGTGLPCRTDRLAALEQMRRYVDIHDIRRYKQVLGRST